MRYVSISILLISIFAYQCGNKKIEITREYIVNENWNKIAKAIKVTKMKLKEDSVLNIATINQADLIRKLEVDSSFIYYANVTTPHRSYKGLKIYFNRKNGFYWTGESSDDSTAIISELEKLNWYKFSHLVTYPLHVYVYIDSSDRVHRFNVNLANY